MTSILDPRRSPGLPRRSQCAIGLLVLAAHAGAQSQVWIQQSGSAKDDGIGAVASDGAKGVFVAGGTIDPSGGGPFGNFKVWVGRFDEGGQQLWRRILDSGAADQLTGAASDGATGVFVCGFTTGSLGGPHSGAGDAWLARYDSIGNAAWIVQVGTAQDEIAFATTSDGAGGAFFAGATSGSFGGPLAGYYDAWLAHHSSDGTSSWIRQLGSVDYDRVDALAADDLGGVFACGSTTGTLGGAAQGDVDVWVARYDAVGQQLWLQQFGTPQFDQVHGAAPDGLGGVFLVGRTGGSLGGPNAGDTDAWLARFDASGSMLWMRQLGTAAEDRANGCTPDGSGGVIATGATAGDLGGDNLGGFDAWLARFDADGNALWVEQLGTAADDRSAAACTSTTGATFLGGTTYGVLGGPAAGFADAWLARYDGACTSGETYCSASSTSIASCSASIGASGSPTLSDPSLWTVSSGPVPGANLGLLLFGASGPDSTPYGTLGGLLCVASPTFRSAPTSSGGDSGRCNGSYAFTLADLIATSPIVTSGATIRAQVWARDPANQDGFLLSDGIAVTVCP